MSGQSLNRLPQDVGDDLHPDAARRSAIRGDEALGLVADVVHDFDVMRDGVGVGFEKGSPQVADIVRQREPVDGRARVRVVDRRLFAEKIGRDDEPVAAGGARLREPVQPLMEREAGFPGGLSFAGSELASEPVEGGASGRHAAVRDEEPGLEMVIQEEARVRPGVVSRGQDIDRAAEFEQHVARVDDARAERGSDMVRGAADDRRSGLKAALNRALA